MSALAMLDGALCYPYASCTDVPPGVLASSLFLAGLTASDVVVERVRRTLWRVERRLHRRWGLLPEGEP